MGLILFCRHDDLCVGEGGEMPEVNIVLCLSDGCGVSCDQDAVKVLVEAA